MGTGAKTHVCRGWTSWSELVRVLNSAGIATCVSLETSLEVKFLAAEAGLWTAYEKYDSGITFVENCAIDGGCLHTDADITLGTGDALRFNYELTNLTIRLRCICSCKVLHLSPELYIFFLHEKPQNVGKLQFRLAYGLFRSRSGFIPCQQLLRHLPQQSTS